MVGIIMTMVAVLTTALWAIIGFMFWIPMLARHIAIFTATAFTSALSGKTAESHRGYLERAIIFYSSGFALIWKSVFEPVSDTQEPLIVIDWMHVILEVGTTVIFWGGAALLLGL